MSDIVLFVLDEGFDDMSLLSCQVILEENGYDIIISARKSGAIKGEESSVIVVSLDDALNQNIDYKGLIIIGGAKLNEWVLLDNLIQKLYNSGKIIGGLNNGINLLTSLGKNISTTNQIVIDENIITLSETSSEIENFVDNYYKMILSV